MKKILIVPVLFLLTGCADVTTVPENTCYRYVDYKMEEHYMDYDDNFCGSSYGHKHCRDGKKHIDVYEYEFIVCPVEEDYEQHR